MRSEVLQAVLTSVLPSGTREDDAREGMTEQFEKDASGDFAGSPTFLTRPLKNNDRIGIDYFEV